MLARNDFPNYGGGDPPLIEREYWLRIPQRALQNAGMAGLDGLVILHVHYAGVWDRADDTTAFDKKRSIITQINARYTGSMWTEARVMPGEPGGDNKMEMEGTDAAAPNRIYPGAARPVAEWGAVHPSGA